MIDHWRRRELERTWLEILSILPEEEAPSPETQLLFLETLNTIDRVLDSLKPSIRQAFLLAQLEGFTCPQIAKKLDVSLATVKRYIAKALRRCYECRYEA
uniref:Sigma factor n=1 Tax=Methylophaga nitratireducenticrescens TaxID=754476 RepID=I1XF88_METNJ